MDGGGVDGVVGFVDDGLLQPATMLIVATRNKQAAFRSQIDANGVGRVFGTEPIVETLAP